MYCTGMVLYCELYRDGSVFCNVPGWFCIMNCTGMVLYYVLYRDDSVLCTVSGWFYIMYCTRMVLYYVLYRDGSAWAGPGRLGRTGPRPWGGGPAHKYV